MMHPNHRQCGRRRFGRTRAVVSLVVTAALALDVACAQPPEEDRSNIETITTAGSEEFEHLSMLAGSPTRRLTQPDPDTIAILPVDGAEFLAGARFDLVVEFPGGAATGTAAVTVNGIPADRFFEATPVNRADPSSRPALIWRGLAAPGAGEYRVRVRVGESSAEALWTVRQAKPGGAKNVILMIADGMTVAEISAARLISRGISNGKLRRPLALDGMEEFGLVHTTALDSIIPDSATTASSMNTGHKARVEATGSYTDSTEDPLDDPRVETFAEIIRRTRGMAVGFVTTAEFNDATPAAVWGHCRDRTLACREFMARAMLDEDVKPEVVLGGGARWVIQRRPDGMLRNLLQDFADRDYAVVAGASGLGQAVERKVDRLVGLFHPLHMNVWLDRNVYRANLGSLVDQPGLVQMTLAALELLQRNPNGFYLQVEAASVDKMMHRMDQERSLADLIEFDRAIEATLRWVEIHAPDTLVVVTSDHGHGYDVYGTVDVQRFRAAETDEQRLNAIGLYHEAGFPSYEDGDGDGFPDAWDVARGIAGATNNHPAHRNDFQVNATPKLPATWSPQTGVTINPADDPSGISISSTLPPDSAAPNQSSHTMQDVPLFASGPGAGFFGRVLDNTEIFFGMAEAIGLDPTNPTGRAAAVERP